VTDGPRIPISDPLSPLLRLGPYRLLIYLQLFRKVSLSSLVAHMLVAFRPLDELVFTERGLDQGGWLVWLRRRPRPGHGPSCTVRRICKGK
jgi:hypothetical protein